VWLHEPATVKDLGTGAASARSFFAIGSTRWNVFDTNGRYLARVNFPAGFEMLAFSKGAAYGSNVNSDGETVLQRVRVTFEK
jgi:hypothetical protein